MTEPLISADEAHARFMDAVVGAVALPYVWGGKGDLVFNTTSLKLEAHPWGLNVFDCSGLVTYAWRLARAQDLRGVYNAQALALHLQRLGARKPSEPSELGALLFFGSDAFNIDHVAVGLGRGWKGRDKLLVVEALGTRATLKPTPGARVYCGTPHRSDFLFSLRLPFGADL